ncbi:MAG TPA: hypothetical protein VEI50_06475 [Nitrospiraceae bacterium]|nr:hypothetical protein [Nitrospiraceae bacterium]
MLTQDLTLSRYKEPFEGGFEGVDGWWDRVLRRRDRGDEAC